MLVVETQMLFRITEFPHPHGPRQMLLFLITLPDFGGVQNSYSNNAWVCAYLAGEREIKKEKQMKWSQACCLLSCVIFKLHCRGHFHLLHHVHVTFSEHSIPLRVIKVSHYFSFSSLRWNVSSVWSGPLWQKSLPLVRNCYLCRAKQQICFYFQQSNSSLI